MGIIRKRMAHEISNPIRFAGQYFDDETGLHYNRFRYYDPQAGRYVNQDPIGLRGGWNQYEYAAGNPTLYTDSLGLDTANAACMASFTTAGAGAGDAAGGWIGGIAGAIAGGTAGTLVEPGGGTVAGAAAGATAGAAGGSVAGGALGAALGNAVCPKSRNNQCPPCRTVGGRIVAAGTVGYRPLDVIPDDEMQHGVFGSHHNIFIANQNPSNCICFWAKQKYVLKPYGITPVMIPVEPFVN